jgi:uncharacterized protein (TIGR02996 family)
MDDRQALMAAIIANPDEDTPRLALADWLDEHGDKHDKARAEFIRLQCELALLPEDAPQTKEHKRAKELHKKHHKAWLGPLHKLTGMHEFRRGLLENWYCTAAEFAKNSHDPKLCQWLPRVGVRSVLITRSLARVPNIATSPALAWISELCWLYTKLNDAGVKALAETVHGSRLTRLLVTDLSCTNIGLRELARSTAFPNLRELGLRAFSTKTEYTHTGILRFLDSEQFPKLEALDLLDALPSGFQETAFYKQPALSRLRHYWASAGCNVRKIAECPHFTRLEWLRIHETDIEEADVLALLDNPALAKLKKLGFARVSFVRSPLSPALVQRVRDRFGSGLDIYDSSAFGKP